MSRFFASSCLALIFLGCESQKTPTADPALDQLLLKINERLLLMEKVAHYKYAKKLPAADSKREEQMLKDLAAKADTVSLPPVSVRWFFSAQIEAAKIVQENHFQRWKADDLAADDSVDLSTLRENIDRINNELLQMLAEFRKRKPARSQIEQRAFELIQGVGIDASVRTTAIRPLLESDGQ